jgi:DNA-directed RNA polymerase subunit RPC12/RpoP
MLSNCPQCGSSLTIKEAVQKHCSRCSRPMGRASVISLLQKGRLAPSVLRKNFDRLIAEELRRSNLSPAV